MQWIISSVFAGQCIPHDLEIISRTGYPAHARITDGYVVPMIKEWGMGHTSHSPFFSTIPVQQLICGRNTSATGRSKVPVDQEPVS